METIIGTSNRILEVDVSTRTFSATSISPRDRRMYLGGKGLGIKLLYDRLKPGIDPFHENNIIAFMMGVLMGTGAPCSGRFEAITKSPLTGIMATSSCGGPFGMALKTTGWDGILIHGKAKDPVFLAVDVDTVEFVDASVVWGKDTQEAQKELLKRGTGAVVIGPAGEHGVRYANICSGHRFLGRGGMGAVMGAKNLKGIVAKGKQFRIKPVDPDGFKKARKKLNQYIQDNSITASSYRNYGTNANVRLSNKAGILPVKNFTGGSHAEAEKISGEHVAAKYDTRHHTCKPCSILCGHRGTFNGQKRVVAEYETNALFGANLQIFDPVAISEWNEICGQMGMDTISAAGTIAWTMEAGEKGLIQTDLRFGSPAGISATLLDIAYGNGSGVELALGTKALSAKYGGSDFAIQIKGMEMPAYDPRGCFGHGLSYAVANRGACHLSATLFSLEAYFGMADPYSVRGKPYMVKFFENVHAAMNSLHICQFTAFAVYLEPPLVKYTPPAIVKFLNTYFPSLSLNLMDIRLWPRLWEAVTGINLSMQRFKKAGERIHVLERYMNTREGVSSKDDMLPGRFIKEGRTSDPRKRTVPLEKMVDAYYRTRGYNRDGIPEKRLLKNLGIL